MSRKCSRDDYCANFSTVYCLLRPIGGGRRGQSRTSQVDGGRPTGPGHPRPNTLASPLVQLPASDTQTQATATTPLQRRTQGGQVVPVSGEGGRAKAGGGLPVGGIHTRSTHPLLWHGQRVQCGPRKDGVSLIAAKNVRASMGPNLKPRITKKPFR